MSVRNIRFLAAPTTDGQIFRNGWEVQHSVEFTLFISAFSTGEKYWRAQQRYSRNDPDADIAFQLNYDIKEISSKEDSSQETVYAVLDPKTQKQLYHFALVRKELLYKCYIEAPENTSAVQLSRASFSFLYERDTSSSTSDHNDRLSSLSSGDTPVKLFNKKRSSSRSDQKTMLDSLNQRVTSLPLFKKK